MAVVATRRRDNDGRFAPTSNCHPSPSLAGEERLRCRPERALDEVAVSELLRRRIARFARLYQLRNGNVRRKLSALAPAGDRRISQRNHSQQAKFFVNLLGSVTMTCQLLTRISDGSSRLLDPTLSINFAESNQDTSKLTPPNFRKTSSGNRSNGSFKFPVRCVQIPCSFEIIPCSAK